MIGQDVGIRVAVVLAPAAPGLSRPSLFGWVSVYTDPHPQPVRRTGFLMLADNDCKCKSYLAFDILLVQDGVDMYLHNMKVSEVGCM